MIRHSAGHRLLVPDDEIEGIASVGKYCEQLGKVELICRVPSFAPSTHHAADAAGFDPMTGRPRNGTVHQGSYPYAVGQSRDGTPLFGIRVICNPDGTLRRAFPV